MSYSKDHYEKYCPLFGAWTIDSTLGSGSYGKVFKIVRNEFGRTYVAAMKAITIPKSSAELQSLRDDGMTNDDIKNYIGDIINNIAEEFTLMSKLKGHSNIVSYEDHMVIPHEDGLGCDILIRMELLTALPNHLSDPGMSETDIAKLGIDLCCALELCQQYDIIHRDIKPENIFINETGNYKLGDFGIARQMEKAQTGLTKTGTPAYMAPEVYNGRDYGPTIDIYSLGIVLYKLLNHNRIPFLPPSPEPITYKDKEYALMTRMKPNPIPPPTGTESKELQRIVLKACEYYPEYRYTSPTDMKHDLERFLYGYSKENPETDTSEEQGAAITETVRVSRISETRSTYHIKADVEERSGRSSGGSSRLIISGKKNVNPNKLAFYGVTRNDEEPKKDPSPPGERSLGSSGFRLPDGVFSDEKKPLKKGSKRLRGDLTAVGKKPKK